MHIFFRTTFFSERKQFGGSNVEQVCSFVHGKKTVSCTERLKFTSKNVDLSFYRVAFAGLWNNTLHLVYLVYSSPPAIYAAII